MTATVPATNEKDLTKINRSIQGLAQGRSNATGTITLALSSATTVVNNVNCAADSTPILTPTTANAAAETWYVSAVANGSFTITHTSSATTGRTFVYALLG